jgi:hypothetical protein
MTEPDPFRENADLIRAFEERPLTGGMKVPDRMLFDLEEARVRALQARKRPLRSSFVVKHSGFLRLAAVLALFAAVTLLLIPTTTPTARIVVTSPGDEITDTRPSIAWTSKDEPGQKYDVWILPEEGDFRDAAAAPTLFKAERVTSPVDFISFKPGKGVAATTLQPGTNYRVLVCLADAGRIAGVPIPFKVKTAP